MKKHLLLFTSIATLYGPIIGHASPADQHPATEINLTAAESVTPPITLDATLGDLVTQDFVEKNYLSLEGADRLSQDIQSEQKRAERREDCLSDRIDAFAVKKYLSEDGMLDILLPNKRKTEKVSFEAMAAHYFGGQAIAIYNHPITEDMSGKFIAIGGWSSEGDALLRPYPFTDQQGDYTLGCYGGADARVAISAPVLTSAQGAEVKNGVARKQTTFMLKAGDTLRLVAQWVAGGDVVYYARLSRAPSENVS